MPALLALALTFGSSAALAGVMGKPKSVVRADARTGRLVRTVIVPAPALLSAPVSAMPGPPATIPAAPTPELGKVIEDTARRYEVDPMLVHSVIEAESNYNPRALSHKGAQGLMQLIPSTARRFGVDNPWDVQQNVEGGVRYLKYLSTLFPDDMRLAIAAYNAGEAAVVKYGNTVPPYRETVLYVDKVGKRYEKARRAAGKTPRKDAAAKAEMTANSNVAPAEEKHPALEYFVDREGRLHMRTKADSGTAHP